MTGEGLPYDAITGEIGIAKGIARTEGHLCGSCNSLNCYDTYP